MRSVTAVLMVFKSMRGSPPYTGFNWAFSIAALYVVEDHPAHIPRRHNERLAGDGSRPARAGFRPALSLWPECPQRSPGSSVTLRVRLPGTFTRARCPAATVMLDAGGAGTYTQRAIPGPEPSRDVLSPHLHDFGKWWACCAALQFMHRLDVELFQVLGLMQARY
jgi:hypothetical protein